MGTRTPEQVRSHAQKVLNKHRKLEEKKKDIDMGRREFEEAPNKTSTRAQRKMRSGYT